MSVAAAITGFQHIEVMWIQRGREQGRQGSVKAVEQYRQPVTAMVTEPAMKMLNLSSDATTIQDDLEIYFAGELASLVDGRQPRSNDQFIIPANGGQVYGVRLARYRPEGGFTHVSVKRVEREQLNV